MTIIYILKIHWYICNLMSYGPFIDNYLCLACMFTAGFSSTGKTETEHTVLNDTCPALQDAKTTAFRPVMKR